MPVFQLTEEYIFPDPHLAEDGFLAVGGDLAPERLLLAYHNGIFPWYNEGEPIIWHAPDPRFVLFPKKMKRSKKMLKALNSGKFTCTINHDFEAVINNCREIKRKDQEGTWITKDMLDAYIEMHKLGYAYSVEVYNEDEDLIGGLYGIKLGTVFFGESMFSIEDHASRIALAHLVDTIELSMIDAQVYTDHMHRLGAEHISLDDFLMLLKQFI
jgi:leucyl/phenylalanyl-tRNA--protein transferase